MDAISGSANNKLYTEAGDFQRPACAPEVRVAEKTAPLFERHPSSLFSRLCGQVRFPQKGCAPTQRGSGCCPHPAVPPQLAFLCGVRVRVLSTVHAAALANSLPPWRSRTWESRSCHSVTRKNLGVLKNELAIAGATFLCSC